MPKPEKLDLYKLHKAEYAASKSPKLVDVGAVLYLSIDGQGEPGGEAFTAGVGAMYGAAFTIKMAHKFAGRDYKVCHLEGLWWCDRKGESFMDVPRDQWRWKLLIRVPDFVGKKDLDQAHKSLLAKGKGPEVTKVALERIEEGQCVQALHVGPYATEPQTIQAMEALAKENGLVFHGRHHEIYLSDPRRVPPDRLRTILRLPVRAAGA